MLTDLVILITLAGFSEKNSDIGCISAINPYESDFSHPISIGFKGALLPNWFLLGKNTLERLYSLG